MGNSKESKRRYKLWNFKEKGMFREMCSVVWGKHLVYVNELLDTD